MNLWTYVHFVCFLVYASAILYVIIKNPYAVINWVLAVLFAYFALWSACSTILNNTGVNLSVADSIMKLQSLGWASFVSYYFLFILYLTNNKKLLSLPFLVGFLLMVPFFFFYHNFKGEMLGCCSPVSYGMAGVWKATAWSYSYFAFYTAVFICSAYLIIRHRNRTIIESEKRVADILLGSTAVVFALGTFISVILNFIGLSVPLDVNVVFLIFTAALIYCAEKYETFTLSSARNAERVMELINEGIVLLDRDGKMTTANRAAMEIFGFSGDSDAKGACLFIEEAIKNSVFRAGGGEVENSEISFKNVRGEGKTALFSSRIITRENNNSGTVCSIRDITGKKQTEKELVKTVRELERSNEELEKFAYVASHDLKEPLRMVTSYVQLIKKKFTGKIGKDGDDYIDFASGGAIRMSRLIDGLLEYSRIRSARADHTEVDTAAVLDRVSGIIEMTIREKKAKISVQGRLPVISADAIQIEQLFLNLACNALKFTSKEPPVITVSAEKRGNEHFFIFRDNGIGIDMQYSEKIFQIFQRLHGRDEYEGTGIGLAICRKIVETHGGKIWVESEGPGKGCSFCFTLPDGKAADSHIANK